MANFRVTALTIVLGVSVTASVACSDDAADKLGGRNVPGGSSGSSGASGGPGGADGGPGTNPGGPPQEEVAFRAVEADLQQKCGLTCHDTATYKPTPPAFLAGPDRYKSIKAQPGAIVADYYQSVLLTKGSHAGPAVNTDPTFEQKLTEWLKIESAVIQAQKKPSTDPVALVAGPNDVDLTKACIGGLTGVHLKFEASLVGGILSLNKIQLVAGAGTDVHILKPKLIKVLAKPNASNQTEIPDGAETFSNTDQTVAGGSTTTLGPGAAFITSAGWTPFDFASDKIRIEIEKLEPGKVQVIEAPKVCKNVAMFTANVLPSMRGAAGGFNLNCNNCHQNGLAGLSLANADTAVVCNQVLQKLNQANIPGSLIITKVNTGPHNGGLIANTAGWTALFVNNSAAFF